MTDERPKTWCSPLTVVGESIKVSKFGYISVCLFVSLSVFLSVSFFFTSISSFHYVFCVFVKFVFANFFALTIRTPAWISIFASLSCPSLCFIATDLYCFVVFQIIPHIWLRNWLDYCMRLAHRHGCHFWMFLTATVTLLALLTNVIFFVADRRHRQMVNTNTTCRVTRFFLSQ